MLYFVFYGTNAEVIEELTNKIHSFMDSKKELYQIIKIQKDTKKNWERLTTLNGSFAYFLDASFPTCSGIDIARRIRETEDWYSPITLYSTNKTVSKEKIRRELNLLDYINKMEDLYYNFNELLSTTYNIIKKKQVYHFKYLGEYYQIPIEDIFYIKKNIHDNSAVLHTKDEQYTINESINAIYSKLNDTCFFKCSRSCIINLNHVKAIDFSNNLVYLNNHCKETLSREGKKIAKDRIAL